MQYNFEWDQIKERSNSDKHGVHFEEAVTVFRDPAMLSLYDNEHSSNEDRWITLGISAKGRLLVVFHTFREKNPDSVVIRIFSARKAVNREIEHYKR